MIFNPANNIWAAAGTSTSGLGNRTLIRSKTTGHMIGRFKSIRISRNGECPLTKNMTNHAAFTSTSYHPLSCNLYNVGLSFATSLNTALLGSFVSLQPPNLTPSLLLRTAPKIRHYGSHSYFKLKSGLVIPLRAK